MRTIQSRLMTGLLPGVIKTMRSIFALSMLLILTLSSGCRPSERVAETYVRQMIAEENQNNNLVNLVSLHKTNGLVKQSLSGTAYYVMECECEIEFSEDCFYDGHFTNAGLRQIALITPIPVKKGQRAKVTGKVHFEKTEKGWRPSKWTKY